MKEKYNSCVYSFFNDELKNECIALLNEIVCKELSKPDNEVNFDLIEDCTSVIVMFAKGEEYNAAEKIASSNEILKLMASKGGIKRGALFKAALIAAIVAVSGITANAAISTATGCGIIDHIAKAFSLNNTPVIYEDTTAAEEVNNIYQYETKKQNPQKKIIEKEPSTSGSEIVFEKTTNKSIIVFDENEKEKLTGKKKKSDKTKNKKEKKSTFENDITSLTDISVSSPSRPVAVKMEVVFVKGAFKKEYKIGEEFSSAGIYPFVIMSDGSKKTISVNQCEIEGFDSAKAGAISIKLKYENVSSSFEVTVYDEENK